MPTLSFEGETQGEIVQKVRRWLASIDGQSADEVGLTDVVNQSAELTKDALRVIAESAPGGVGQSDLIKALTQMGYNATDSTRDATLLGLDAMETATGGSIVRNVAEAGSKAVYEMNAQVAKQFLRALVRD